MGGTLLYVAPEVHRGQAFDEGCDVYAFAIVLWELVTLGRPFDDKPEQAIPGIVGWGAERPTLETLNKMKSEKLNSEEGKSLEILSQAIEGGWVQDPSPDGLWKWFMAGSLTPWVSYMTRQGRFRVQGSGLRALG
eukprot:CAMPEP_0184317090 /NCGR_PEP_ID=MMETSP1049-20130417/94470_1 /TAXON_ID=77928 /ORGANISM="Proteomonas sulcata, Strain CCMP704" /LENGTH=134 /DNA_ID=CAMNT_0026636337 /DNA_START=84 /DNA_END=489 /DNA_ORIENTATION=+